jgi:DNA-binding transcriptional ArsR family regulator
MDMGSPITAVVASLDGEILSVLAGTTRPLTGRDVQRLVRRGSQSGVSSALVRLDQQGIVDVVAAGSSNLYTLNRDHVAAPAVLQLATLRAQLFGRLRDAIASWDQLPVVAVVFGSTARGDGTIESDIDIFLVRPDGVGEDSSPWADNVARLATDGRRWSGNAVSVIQVSADQVAEMAARAEAILDDLRSDGVVLLGSVAALDSRRGTGARGRGRRRYASPQLQRQKGYTLPQA